MVTEMKNAEVCIHLAPWEIPKEMPTYMLQEKCRRMILIALFKMVQNG